ncbi:transglycosylase domain-containing protein [Kribbia dieselivorans]|uniref:transglycosylase domain-containing protein n=1 Tax=Kribbia dieselivorans TaxID=331526 RepID=UPI000837F849|nr:transglycosylase domain-containing protein [Kribbia dieselivorans]
MRAKSQMPHVVSLLAAFVAIAVGMGILAAGIMLPATGAVGQATKGTVQAFQDLPEDFSPIDLARPSQITSADGTVLATPYDANREIVKLQDVAPIMRKAQIAIEDSRFYEHGGIDVRGTARALATNVAGGGVSQGGSSITQQYVKLMLLEKALRDGDKQAANQAVAVSYSRKLQELKYALNVEKTMSKNQILEGYLNLAYYGDLAYGVEAASKHYFSMSAKDLDLSRAATLAGVVQNPGTADPRNNPQRATERRNLVLDRMLELGMITPEAAAAAKAKPMKSLLKISTRASGTCAKSPEPYVCNYVIDFLKTDPKLGVLGENPDARMRTINTAGLKIKTTVDTRWQKQIYRTLTSKVPNGDASGVGAAMATVEPGTGAVKAIVQTSQYKTGLKKASSTYSEQSWTVPQAYGGTAGFAIGSTAKPYTLAEALEKGRSRSSTVLAPTADTVNPATFYADDFQKPCTTVAPWKVRNDAFYSGQIPLQKLITESVNTATVQLAKESGSCDIHALMTKMGLRNGTGEEYGKDIAAIVLGADTAPPLTVAASYATFGADGMYCTPNPIAEITNNKGKVVYKGEPDCTRALKTSVARDVAEMLRGPLESIGGNGTATNARLAGGRMAAGKTGTTDSHVQSWFVGTTPQYSTAVFVGNPMINKPMENISIGGQFYPKVFGGTIAAPLWKSIMDQEHKGLKMLDFGGNVVGKASGSTKANENNATPKLGTGPITAIPPTGMMTEQQAISTLQAAGFEPVVGATTRSQVAPAGQVSYTEPQGQAPRGTRVVIHLSSGP